MFIYKLKQHQKLLILIALGLATIYLTSINLLIIVCSLYIIYSCLRQIVSSSLFSSKLFVASLALFIYVSLYQCTLLISWAVSKDIPLDNIPILTLLFAVFVYALQRKYLNASKSSNLPFLNLDDKIALSIAFIILGFVSLPVLRAPAIDTGAFFNLINTGIDDANHVALLNDKIQYNKAVITEDDEQYPARIYWTSRYPIGWHSVNAALISSIQPDIKTGAASVIAYIANKVFWFGFLVFIFCRATLALYRRSTVRQTFPSLATIAVLCLFFSFIFLIDTFSFGFYSFFPQLITISLLLPLMLQLYTIRKRNYRNFYFILLMSAFVAANSVLSWLLLAPALLISLILCISDFIIRSKKIPIKTQKFIDLFILAIPFVAISAATIIQFLLSSLAPSASDFATSILHEGGVVAHANIFYVPLLIGFVIFVLQLKGKLTYSILTPSLNLLLPGLFFCLLILCLQLYLVQSARYYFYKVLLVSAFLLIILSVVGFSHGINYIARRLNTRIALYSALLIPIVFTVMIYQTPGVFGYVRGLRALTHSTNKQILTILEKEHTEANFFNKDVSVFYPNQNPSLNEIASALVQSNKPLSKCYMSVKSASFTKSISKFDGSEILQSCDGYHLSLYVDSADLEHVNQVLAAKGLTNKVDVRTIQY